MKTPRLIIAYLIMITGTAYGANSTQVSPQDHVSIEDIVQLSEFSGLDVCPGKNLIAVRVDKPNTSVNTTYHNWVIIEWPSASVRLKASAGETVITNDIFVSAPPQWSPDCQWIFYRARQDGEVQIWRLNTHSGRAEKVTSDDADILAFELADNGRQLVYKVGAERSAISAAEMHEYEYGVLYNETIFPNHPPLVKTYPVEGRWGAARRWNSVEKGHLLSQQPSKYKILRVGDRKARMVSETEVSAALKEDPVRIDWIRVENAGATIAPSGDKAVVKMVTEKSRRYDDPSITTLASISRNDPSKIRKCSVKLCTSRVVEFLKWSEDGSTLYFISEQTRGAAGIYTWSPETDEVQIILQTEGTLGALADEWSQSRSCPILENTAFCTAAAHNAPPRLLAIDLKSGSFQTVFDPNAALREKFNLKTERIRWMDRFGRNALGIIAYPRNFQPGKRYPLVITTHWCRGFLRGGVGDGGPEYALAERGFFVLCVDVGSPYPPIEETIKYSPGPRRFVAMVSEYETAIEMLAKKGFIDRRRVGITAISMGSRAVSYMLTHSDYIAAATTRMLGTISPEIEMLATHPKSEVHAVLMMIFNIDEDGQNKELVFNDLDMARRADRVKAPILVQANESEYLISLSSVHALLKLNKPVEMHIFPDETHVLHQPVHRFVNFTRNLDWFRFWLQDYEDPDPEKADQYTRWRKMRDEQCAQLKDQDNAPWYCRH